MRVVQGGRLRVLGGRAPVRVLIASRVRALPPRFRGGLVFKAHRLVYHSTLGSRVIKKKKNKYGTLVVIDSALVSGEVSHGEKMTLRGSDPESYITEYTIV